MIYFAKITKKTTPIKQKPGKIAFRAQIFIKFSPKCA